MVHSAACILILKRCKVEAVVKEKKICYWDRAASLRVFPNRKGGGGCSRRRCARNKFAIANFIKRKRPRKKMGKQWRQIESIPLDSPQEEDPVSKALPDEP